MARKPALKTEKKWRRVRRKGRVLDEYMAGIVREKDFLRPTIRRRGSGRERRWRFAL